MSSFICCLTEVTIVICLFTKAHSVWIRFQSCTELQIFSWSLQKGLFVRSQWLHTLSTVSAASPRVKALEPMWETSIMLSGEFSGWVGMLMTFLPSGWVGQSWQSSRLKMAPLIHQCSCSYRLGFLYLKEGLHVLFGCIVLQGGVSVLPHHVIYCSDDVCHLLWEANKHTHDETLPIQTQTLCV